MDRVADPELDVLLREAGSTLDAAQAAAIVAGAAAAPGDDGGMGPEDAWMRMIAPEPTPALAVKLRQMLAEAAAESEAKPDFAARLAALRAELAKRKLAGFVVPLADEHQGEYVSRRARRLAWLTGFSGSAGVAVVLADKAAIFVDGRYTLQAKAQVPADLFEQRHVSEDPPTDWIAANLPKDAKLGFDPWLHTADGTRRLARAAAKAGGELTAALPNPIDAVWPDQPAAALTPVVAHPAAFAGETSGDKRRRIAERLAEAGEDAAVLTAPDSLAWLANVRGGDVPYTPLPLGFGVLAADGTLELFMDERKVLPETRTALGNGITLRPPDDFEPALKALGAAKCTVRADPASAAEAIFRALKEAGATLSTGPDPCALPKARKNAVELDGIRAAHRRDGAALTRFLAWLAEAAPNGGVTEISAADKLEAFRRENEHFQGLSFPTISGAGPNGAIVHYRVSAETDRELETGTLYLVDSGGQYLDGTTDVTRTIAVGAPSDEMRANFTRVLKGHIAIARSVFPAGTSGSQIDVLARAPLWSAGLDYDHGTGHGVGSFLGVHEGPQRISKVPNRVALEPGMVVSNEPGYYKTDAYGIRIENLVTVTKAEAPQGAERELLGFETLTLAPIDLALVDAAMLDGDERAWLNAYHARVRDTLSPLVDDATSAWLEAATRAI